MGERVLSVTVAGGEGLIRVYAHCSASTGDAGSLSLLLINLDPLRAASVSAPGSYLAGARQYRVTSPALDDAHIWLNGRSLELSADGDLPAMPSQAAELDGKGALVLPPRSAEWVTTNARLYPACHLSEAPRYVQGR